MAHRDGPSAEAAIARPMASRAMLWSGIFLSLAPIVIVNFWIYRALVVYAANNPEIVAARPVTISRAITEPAVAGDFAAWVTLSAALLVPAVAIVAVIHLRFAASLGPQGWGIAAAGYALVVFQTVSGIGMITLSWFRFPDHDEVHMVGSYFFFVGQSLVIVSAMVATVLVGRRAGASTTPLHPWAGRVRVWLGYVVVALALAYLVFFVVKDMALGAASGVIYRLYTLAEPTLISCYLVFWATYLIDLARLIRRA